VVLLSCFKTFYTVTLLCSKKTSIVDNIFPEFFYGLMQSLVPLGCVV